MKPAEQDIPYIEAVEDFYQEEQSEDGLCVSEEEYWEKYYNHLDFAYEWNNGILEEKPKAVYQSSEMYCWFLFSLLKEYLKISPVATPLFLGIGFRMALPGKISIRKPDLPLFHHSNPIGIHKDDTVYKGIFDLCTEFLSDSEQSEIDRDTVIKKAEYRQAGVREYFILDANGNETAFYRLTGKNRYSHIPDTGGIIRSEVLPGFQFRIEDLYSQPDLRERINDRVYKSFILLDCQEAEKRAERAEAECRRAEAERRRAEAEQKYEKYAAKLISLGIDPESV